jgi:CRISPR system Cascade subunit CasD
MAERVARTLLLRFAGPQQSWGSTELADRNTEAVPTRSGVIGMLGAALGAERGALPEWLWALELWVRVDRRGELSTDFHTVGAPSKKVEEIRNRFKKTVGAGGKADYAVPLGNGSPWKLGGGTMVTNRQYLADAEFLVAISHPDEARIDELAAATRNPVFTTYLGRKAFAPTFPFHLGARTSGPRDLLATLPTRNTDRRPLALHPLLGDRNYPTEKVTVPITDTLKGWAA